MPSSLIISHLHFCKPNEGTSFPSTPLPSINPNRPLGSILLSKKWRGEGEKNHLSSDHPILSLKWENPCTSCALSILFCPFDIIVQRWTCKFIVSASWLLVYIENWHVLIWVWSRGWKIYVFLHVVSMIDLELFWNYRETEGRHGCWVFFLLYTVQYGKYYLERWASLSKFACLLNNDMKYPLLRDMRFLSLEPLSSCYGMAFPDWQKGSVMFLSVREEIFTLLSWKEDYLGCDACIRWQDRLFYKSCFDCSFLKVMMISFSKLVGVI